MIWSFARLRTLKLKIDEFHVLEDAEKLGIEMSPIDGATVLKSIARAAATPRNVIARYNALVGADKN